MSSSSLDLDFGNWCTVCDRAIPPPPSPPIPVPSSSAIPPSPALSSHSTTATKPPKRISSSGKLGPRRKSTTKIHPGGPKRANSHGALVGLGLTASTTIHPPKNPPPAKHLAGHKEVEPPPVSPTTTGVSSLYCSEECRRIDELRTGFVFGQLGNRSSDGETYEDHGARSEDYLHAFTPGNGMHFSIDGVGANGIDGGGGVGESEKMARRRSSGLSNNSSSGGGQGFASRGRTGSSSSGYFDGLDRNATNGNVDARRSGSEGRFRTQNRSRSRESNSSTGDYSDDHSNTRSEHWSGVRPPSALSALRFMTPISPLSSSSTTSLSVHNNHPTNPLQHPRRPTATRYNTDVPRSQLGTLAKEIRGPPLPSPRAAEAASGSAPIRSTLKKVSNAEVKGKGVLDGVRISARPFFLSPTDVFVPVVAFQQELTSALNRTSRQFGHDRSASSASLALMGTSLGRSYDKGGWGDPKRTASTASLSGLVAQGEMISVAEIATTSPTRPTVPLSPPFTSRGRSIVKASPVIKRNATSLSSSHGSTSNSASSFAYSTRSSNRSTNGTSDYPPSHTTIPQPTLHQPSSSSYFGSEPSVGSSTSSHSNSHLGTAGRPHSINGGNQFRRRSQGLTMTPSATSLNTTTLDSTPQTQRREHSWSSDRTPTQSFSTTTNGKSKSTFDERHATASSKFYQAALAKQRASEHDEEEGGEGGGTVKAVRHHDLLLSHHPDAITTNPSLSYLNRPTHPPPPPSSSPSSFTGPQRTWSWDTLSIPTYQALDVNKQRRDRGEKLTEEEKKKERGEKKKLFHFGGAEGDEF